MNFSTLFETIAIVDGKIQNLSYHQKRYEQGMLYLQHKKVLSQNHTIQLQSIVDIPSIYQQGVIRCRIDYDGLHHSVEFYPYQARLLSRFKVIQSDDIDYQYKYVERKIFQQLLDKKQTADDIIIIQHGLVTDCSIGNLLFLKNQQWFTPKYPLLAGTQREKLLDEQKIQTKNIAIQDIFTYEKMMMINAMNPFSMARAIDISSATIF